MIKIKTISIAANKTADAEPPKEGKQRLLVLSSSGLLTEHVITCKAHQGETAVKEYSPIEASVAPARCWNLQRF